MVIQLHGWAAVDARRSAVRRERNRAYRAAHREEERERDSARREERLAYWARYRAAHPERRAWQEARRRVANSRNPDWKHYGGRGITMAAEWLNGFAAFLAHVGPRPGPEYSLDRIDNDRGYEPGNVRWATRSEQQRNKRPRTKRVA